ERQGAQWNARVLLTSGFNITTFGEDEAGEIYVANAQGGVISRVEGARAPRLTATGVVNAASFVQGLTPGSLATILSAGILDNPGITSAPGIPLPSSLRGVSVTIGGIAAPIQFIANSKGDEQVTVQVPFGVRGRASAAVAVTRDGQSS